MTSNDVGWCIAEVVNGPGCILYRPKNKRPLWFKNVTSACEYVENRVKLVDWGTISSGVFVPKFESSDETD